MSDGSLSQDEIDALLQGSGMDLGGSGGSGGGTDLSDAQKQQFAKILGGIVASQASNLSGMIGESVTLKTPTVDSVEVGDLPGMLKESMVEVKIDYTDGLSGFHSYLIPEAAATAIAGKMMGQEEVELNDAALSAIEEAVNTLAGTAATSLGDVIDATVMNAPGETQQVSPQDVQTPSGKVVKAVYPFTIDDNQESQLVELFEPQVVMSVLEAAGGGQQQQQQAPQQQQQAPQQGMQQGMPQGMQMNQGQQQAAFQGGFQGGFQQGGQMGGQNMGQQSVQSVQFPSLNPQSGGSEQGNIGLLMDVYMEMTVELGRTRRLIKDILGMGEGTIIELDKLAGEPVDILVNHKLIAKGEVVVIDENFGVRVTEIVSPMDRVEGMS
jgi:flagellar motor switch protein FliN/FliY